MWLTNIEKSRISVYDLAATTFEFPHGVTTRYNRERNLKLLDTPFMTASRSVMT